MTQCQVKIKDFKNDEEMIRFAAEGCYYPHNDRRELAMLFVIERLVLPNDVDGYGIEDMDEFIRRALIDATRRNERVVGVVDEH